MEQKNVNIRMDEELKNQFSEFCSNVGMNMTTAFCIFAKTTVRKQRIPFEISSDYINIPIPKNLPNGHERSFRRGVAAAISQDRRNANNQIKIPDDIPEGHNESYRRGYEQGTKTVLTKELD